MDPIFINERNITKYFLKQTSFSIRNLKRSVIKEFFVKEEAKRKNFGGTSQNGVNQISGDGKFIISSQFFIKKSLEFILFPFVAIEMIPNQNSPSRIFVNETTTSILSHANVNQTPIMNIKL